MRVLVVCTGNICRSPMGEAQLRARLADRGVEAHVSSAGTATVDRPAQEAVVELLARRDLDVTEHRSQLLTQDLIAASDLIIGMAREHVREVCLLEPAAFGRTFTLKELVRIGQVLGPAGTRRESESLEDWLHRIGGDREAPDLLGDAQYDDVDDPMGRRFKVYKRVDDEIDDLTGRLVELMIP